MKEKERVTSRELCVAREIRFRGRQRNSLHESTDYVNFSFIRRQSWSFDFRRIRSNDWAFRCQNVRCVSEWHWTVIRNWQPSTPWMWRIKALGGLAILMDVASIILYCNKLVTTFLVSLQRTSFMSKRVEQVFYRVNHPVVLAACSLLSFKLERTRSHPGNRFCQNAADSLCESDFPLTILDWENRAIYLTE